PLLQAVMKSSPLGYSPSPLNGERAGVRGETNTMRVSTQLNLVNIGNAQILTIPGEALPNIGCYLKRKMRGEHNLLFGLTNDAFGYILSRVDWSSFPVYNYVSRTCLGEMTGELYIDEALKLVAETPAPESASGQARGLPRSPVDTRRGAAFECL